MSNIIDRINDKLKFVCNTDKLHIYPHEVAKFHALYECIMEDVKQLIGNSDELKKKDTEHEIKIDEMVKNILRKGKV